MKKKLAETDLPMLLGPGLDILKLWVSSFTVDEYQAFAAIYRILGARIPNKNIYFSFQRSGFRRAGQGAFPRSWLNPFDIPSEKPLPTYHPKLFLSETSAGYSLVISTGNMAKDDLFNTNNFAVQLNLDRKNAKSVADWIEEQPSGHRALCLLADNKNKSVIATRSNSSSLSQFLAQAHSCKSCRASTPRGEWIVAAPFWSTEAFIKMTRNDPDGVVEAYFRDKSIWQQIACSLKQNSKHTVNFKRIKAFELINNGVAARWHHKIIGWRCCNGKHANSLFYLGSANATACGFFGTSTGKTVNWEAGAIWKGGNELWEYTRAVARAGFSAKKLSVPLNCPANSKIDENDDIGTPDTEEMERIFAAHLARCVRVKKTAREVGRRSGMQGRVRVLGHEYCINVIGLRSEDRHGQVKELPKLTPKKYVKIKNGHYAQLYGVFKIVNDGNADMPQQLEVSIDLFELDPNPALKHTKPTRKDAIAAALAGLMEREQSDGKDGGSRKKGEGTKRQGILDVRFPFSSFLSFAEKNRWAAEVWLERIANSDEDLMKHLPEFWSQLATMIQKMR